MEEVKSAIVELLTEEAGSGGDLDGYTILEDENDAYPKDSQDLVIVLPLVEKFIKNSNYDYELVEANLLIRVLRRVGKKDSDKFKAAAAITRAKSKLVRKKIYSNPALVTATYPNGLVYDKDCSKFIEDRPALMAEDDVWFTLNQLTFQTQIIYRNGVIALK